MTVEKHEKNSFDADLKAAGVLRNFESVIRVIVVTLLTTS